ncbi:hypothetical protein Taro_002935 [Colocasia esculenta]|uniref:Uncharacterized protein n=1 Tax=Colocasia esculenta TaxID=4460 RepID=A0A843TME1_COLES|nr:hypothetical protein [Colocasia esculenta]
MQCIGTCGALGARVYEASMGCRVLNATLLPVAFLLPHCGADRLHVCHVLGAGRPVDVSLEKATPSALLVGGTDTGSRHWSPASPF